MLDWAQGCRGEACDDRDEEFFGDPLLGAQDEVAADACDGDVTGDPGDAIRSWYSGADFATLFEDTGLLTTMVEVTGVDCREDDALPQEFDLGSCTFTDVDRQDAVDPDVEALLTGAREDARGAWLLVRDGPVQPADVGDALGGLP